jgi:hypothetical protein
LSHDPAGDIKRAPGASIAEGTDEVLRAKYLDFCSARLTEVFLSLSEERIYRLVEEAAREANLQVGTLNFQTMVRLVTKKLEQSVPLPDLQTWVREYEAEPDRFEEHLLGLWKELVGRPDTPESGEGSGEGENAAES